MCFPHKQCYENKVNHLFTAKMFENIAKVVISKDEECAEFIITKKMLIKITP